VLAGYRWRRVIDTALASPHDIMRPEQQTGVESEHYVAQPRAVVVLEAG
jgi:isoamylase